MSSDGPPLKLEKVTKSYGKLVAVRDIDLELGKGERFVLLGPNGSGKSTLLRIAASVLIPDAGEVTILGKTSQTDIAESRSRMGAVFDHSSHWDKLTGFENAAFFAGCYRLRKGSFEKRLEDLFKWTNLWNDRNRTVASYSFGMRRKLALIEALAHHPQLILLDEPSMGLDYASRLGLYTLLEEESLRGTTILLSTNDVHEAAAMGERVGVMHHGSFLQVGKPSDLLRREEGTATVEIRLLFPLALDFSGIEGVLESLPTDQGWKLRVRSGRNASPPCLPTIVDRVVLAGGVIEKVEVKWPDLGNLLPRGT